MNRRGGAEGSDEATRKGKKKQRKGYEKDEEQTKLAITRRCHLNSTIFTTPTDIIILLCRTT
eukprot:scaffold90117_cov16-Prasinocladus_malaysianus.AAC.1